MFENKREKVVPLPVFIRRVALTLLLTFGVLSVALGIGVVGYHAFAGLGWVDATLNASMILTGMGPVDPMQTTGAKLFASAYALFSGVVFLTAVGIILAPVYHRMLHKFHLDDPAGEGTKDKKPD